MSYAIKHQFLDHEEAVRIVETNLLKYGCDTVWMGPKSLLWDRQERLGLILRTNKVPHRWNPRMLQLSESSNVIAPYIHFLPNVLNGTSTCHVPLLVIENALEWGRRELVEALLIPTPTMNRDPEVLFVGHSKEKVLHHIGHAGVLLGY